MSLEQEVIKLRDWKAQALQVLKGWDKVYDYLGRPGELGQHYSEAVLDELKKMHKKSLEKDAEIAYWKGMAKSFASDPARHHDLPR